MGLIDAAKAVKDGVKVVAREVDFFFDGWTTEAEKDYIRRTGRKPPPRF